MVKTRSLDPWTQFKQTTCFVSTKYQHLLPPIKFQQHQRCPLKIVWKCSEKSMKGISLLSIRMPVVVKNHGYSVGRITMFRSIHHLIITHQTSSDAWRWTTECYLNHHHHLWTSDNGVFRNGRGDLQDQELPLTKKKKSPATLVAAHHNDLKLLYYSRPLLILKLENYTINLIRSRFCFMSLLWSLHFRQWIKGMNVWMT